MKMVTKKMTKEELKQELRTKLKQAGFSSIEQMVRNYSTSKKSLELAIKKVDAVIKSQILESEK